MNLSPVEYEVAAFVRPGHHDSGDRHLVCRGSAGEILIAVVDGIGHGAEAATAANAAIDVLTASSDTPVISLVQRCHEALRAGRGVVLSLASIDPERGMMTWIGIGNVQGILIRAGARRGSVHETLLLRGGVVGSQLPPLQAAVLPFANGDTLVFATDGIASNFADDLSSLESPRRAADRILQQHCRGNDDALVLVARLTKVRE